MQYLSTILQEATERTATVTKRSILSFAEDWIPPHVRLLHLISDMQKVGLSFIHNSYTTHEICNVRIRHTRSVIITDNVPQFGE